MKTEEGRQCKEFSFITVQQGFTSCFRPLGMTCSTNGGKISVDELFPELFRWIYLTNINSWISEENVCFEKTIPKHRIFFLAVCVGSLKFDICSDVSCALQPFFLIKLCKTETKFYSKERFLWINIFLTHFNGCYRAHGKLFFNNFKFYNLFYLLFLFILLKS